MPRSSSTRIGAERHGGWYNEALQTIPPQRQSDWKVTVLRYHTVAPQIVRKTTKRRGDGSVRLTEEPVPKRKRPTARQTLSTRRRTPPTTRSIDDDAPIISQILNDSFERRKEATKHFRNKPTAKQIRSAMRVREKIIENIVASFQASCACCGVFAALKDLKEISIDDDRLDSMRPEGQRIQLDNCALANGQYRFCHTCFQAISLNKEGAPPKFSARNGCNDTMCDQFPFELENLSVAEEYLIARSRPLGIILKLKPKGQPSPVAYNAIRGHIITFPQEPAPLLHLLPSPILQPHEHIRVVWTGPEPPTVQDLKRFLTVDREKVRQALLWLCRHNDIYKNVQVDHAELDTWPESFVPPVLQKTVAMIADKEDSNKRGTYAGDMSGLSENDLHAALDDMADDTIASGAVYSDIESERQLPELQIVTALVDMMGKDEDGQLESTGSEEMQVPVISYQRKKRLTLLSDYDNPEFFIGAFPTLFPYGRGGHIPFEGERDVPVSIHAWGKWLLSHHSRRFARHHTFMYLLYDVIQRRMSAIGHGVMCKRESWDHVKNILASLTHEQLLSAAESLRKTQRTDDPAIATLRRAVQAVAATVPNSFAQKLDMRLHIRALMVEYGPAAFWITLNPNDLKDWLVLKIAGETLPLPKNTFSRSYQQVREVTARMNPAAIATFFHAICKSVLIGLIKPESNEPGILGDVSTYFGVVEVNGRGMLHVHCLVWLMGNLELIGLREKMLHDGVVAAEMIDYLESIISESIDVNVAGATTEQNPAPGAINHEDAMNDDLSHQSSCPITTDFDTDEAFYTALYRYGTQVAAKRQMHARTHNSTCYKYGNGKQCRFGYPRRLVQTSHVDDIGTIHLRRDDEWVNPYDISLSAATGSNHDISFLATRTKALALLYYITNYATKDEASTYEMVMTAAALKDALERAGKAVNPTDEEQRILNRASKFALRVFNRMASDREVSGVQVASMILQLPAYYTPPVDMHRINLYYLRRRFETIVCGTDDETVIGEEEVPITSKKTCHVSIFDDYKWRGERLSRLSLYEYVKMIKKRPLNDKTSSDIPFDTNHPEHKKKMQTICSPHTTPKLVALVGHISLQQPLEDKVPNGHVETAAMSNDLAVVLLGLFVPWQDLPSLFKEFHSTCGEDCEARCDKSRHTGMQICNKVWTAIKDTLPEHIQDLARNVELLRKSKEDAAIDSMERQLAVTPMLAAADPDMQIDEEQEEPEGTVMFSTDIEALRSSFFLLKKRWAKEDANAAIGKSALERRDYSPTGIATSQPIVLARASGIRQDISHETISCWRSLIEGAKQAPVSTSSPDNGTANTQWNPLEQNTEMGSEADCSDGEVDPYDDDEDLANEFGILEPTIIFADPNSETSLANRAAELKPEPSASDVVRMVTKVLPLNQKQTRAITMIFHHVLRNRGKAAIEHEEQFRLYIGGEGGTGKTRIIDAIKDGMRLLGRGQEFIVGAPSGCAAKNIHGNTIHSIFGISPKGGKCKRRSSTLDSIWAEKTMLIIDEISMVSSVMLDRINNQCTALKGLDRDSTALFGGLHVVVVLGDFHQFAPIGSKPLWGAQTKEEGRRGRELWHSFNHAILLDEQMRQLQDTKYHELVKRARNGEMTMSDVETLNARHIKGMDADASDSVCIVRKNQLRHMVNRMQIEKFARARHQKIYAFPAHHSRVNTVNASHQPGLDIVLGIPDEGATSAPGILLYTPNMPALALHNSCTVLGIVNGMRGRIIDVVPEDEAKFYPVDDLYILCNKPPKCVLFDEGPSQENPRVVFPELNQTTLPIFPIITDVEIPIKGNQQMNIVAKRTQIPITPAWALTEYKIQGSTYSNATLDLHRASQKGTTSHGRYCSVYVQLSRVRSLAGVSLLEPVTLHDLSGKPEKLLIEENKRLANLANATDLAWKLVEEREGY